MSSFRPTLLLSILSLSILVGCPEAPKQAPEDINNVSRFLYAEWDNEDPLVMEDGVAKLEEALLKVDLKADSREDRSFKLSPLTLEDIEGLKWPEGQDPAKATTTISVARLSKWPVTDHAKVQVSPDQLPLEPTAKAYTRTFTNPTDPASCFPERGCEIFETFNNITRSNFFIEVTFDLHKVYRWVKLPGDRWAFVSRSWTERVFPGKDDDTAINQSGSLDVWLGQADGTTIRYQALYSDTKISITDEDLVLGTVADSTDDTIEKGDEVIGKRFHGEK